MVTAPARRVVVRSMTERGLSERRALAVMGMSASALRYTPGPDRNAALRARIVALAHRHRRYGAGMIHLKLRQAGERVNHKRVASAVRRGAPADSPSPAQEGAVVDRQPLIRPTAPNEVWSADFVFDRTAEGRVLKCLAIVDDATTEAVALVPARALGGLAVTRVLDRLALDPRPAAGAPDRQRPGVLRPGDADVGARAWRHAAADRAGKAESERLHRIVQRPLPRRVPERALVHQPRPCGGRHRSVAA